MTVDVETPEQTLERLNGVTEEPAHVLHIPDASGDTRIMWNPRDKAEVATAEAAFDAARAKGMLAYRIDDETGKPKTGEVIRTFDKKAGKIVMAKPTQGG